MTACPDLVVDDLANQMYALYQNAGDGTFNYITKTSGIGRMSMLHSGWGLRFIDYDNDGWKDLLIAQGHDLDTIELTNPQLRYREPMLLARNKGQGSICGCFGGIGQRSSMKRGSGAGLAMGDIDNDGRMDAVVSTNGGPAYVIDNETKTDNHWLTLKLDWSQEQPGRDWRGGKNGYEDRPAIRHGHHREQLSLRRATSACTSAWRPMPLPNPWRSVGQAACDKS